MPTTRSKLLRQFALGLGLAGLAAACGVSTIPDPSAGEPSKPVDLSQPLKVATAPPFPPFEMKGENELVGFDIDLINAISQQAGLKIELQVMPFGEILPTLQAGRVDLAISAIPITPDRLQQVSFSRPYMDASLVIAVREETLDIASADDLQGKALAVQLETDGADRAAGIMGSKITTFDDAPGVLTALNQGKVEAVLHNRPALLSAIATTQLRGIRLLDPPLENKFYGIALPPKSPYSQTINQALTDLIENGTYAQLYQKWFGSTPPALPKTAP